MTFVIIIYTSSTIKGFKIRDDKKPDAKFVGGWRTYIKQTPYHVGVEFLYSFGKYGTSFTCGSSIIGTQWLLIVAHCMNYKNSKPYKVRLKIGVDDRSDIVNMPQKDGHLPNADFAICHKNYRLWYYKDRKGNRTVMINDICLLRVDHNLQFGNYVKRVGLPWKAYDRNITNKELVISGFGYRTLSGPSSNELFSTNVRLISDEECEKETPQGYDRETKFCAKRLSGLTCIGDSGGGLIYNDSVMECPIIVGIASSLSEGCDNSHSIAKFTRVIAYQDWIERMMERYNRPPNIENSETYNYPQRNQ